MQYVNLGNTGLRVSRVCLGMMSFGAHESRAWALPESEAEPIVRRAVEGGITFFDTADVYNGGESEVVTGRVLSKLLSREELVVATKVHGQTMPGENGRGLSRKHVMASIDASLQRSAETLVEKGLSDIEHRPGYKHPRRGVGTPLKEGTLPEYLQGALVAMDPTTGYVRAMVGGRNFDESRFNRATQAKRQAGSAFKPFVYATALEAGYSPASVITNLNDPIATPQGGWVPEDEHSTADSMTLRTALRTSSNRAAVQLLNGVGIKNTVGYAERLNVGTMPSVPSLALGAGEVTLMSLTAAYGAFADEGIVRQPVLIRRVEDRDGKVLYQEAGKSHRAVSESTAFLMSSMLSDVINSGTAYRARQAGFVLPAAGKTGTTNDYVDAWFVGFTPHLVTGVWIGFDQPTKIIANGYAGELAVPVWASFMKVATKADKPDWFDRPSNIVTVNVCRVSGKLPNGGCDHVEVVNRDGGLENRSMIYSEYFVKGTEPTELCPLHPSPSLMDRIAGVFGAGESGKPVHSEDAGPPPAQTGTTGAHPPAPAPADVRQEPPPEQNTEAPPKKRGFWARVFGKGDKKPDQNKEQDPKDQNQKKKGG